MNCKVTDLYKNLISNYGGPGRPSTVQVGRCLMWVIFSLNFLAAIEKSDSPLWAARFRGLEWRESRRVIVSGVNQLCCVPMV